MQSVFAQSGSGVHRVPGMGKGRMIFITEKFVNEPQVRANPPDIRRQRAHGSRKSCRKLNFQNYINGHTPGTQKIVSAP